MYDQEKRDRIQTAPNDKFYQINQLKIKKHRKIHRAGKHVCEIQERITY